MRFFGRKLSASKNFPTPRRRGFLHEITQFLIDAGSRRADNSDEAWYQLLMNEAGQATACDPQRVTALDRSSTN